MPITNKDNTFTILTDDILQISTDSTDVYTFRIETPTKSESDFENFVIHKSSDESISYYIYSYKNLDADLMALNVSREKVSEDQINVGDFNDYIPSVMFYDAVSDCWINVTSDGGNLVIDISDCGDISGTGGSGITGGGASGSGFFTLGGTIPNVSYTFGNWEITGVINGQCILNRPLLNTNGSPLYSTQGNPLYQSTTADCQDSSTYSNGDTGSTDPWGDSGDTGSNYDPLHNSSGGGGTTSTNDTTSNDSDINEGEVIGVLAPTRLELEIDSFFDNLTQEQKDCLNTPFNQLEKQITSFFEANQTIIRPSLDSTIYDGALIDSSLKDFAHVAIDARCSGGEVDFPNKVILDNEFINNPCLNSVYSDMGKASTIKGYLQNFDPNFTNPVANFKTICWCTS